MTQRNFEAEVTIGKAQWITSIVHDEPRSRVEVWLTRDVRHFRPERVIAFEQVRSFEYSWTDKEDGSIEGLLGIDEAMRAMGFQYLITTEQREIEIVTSKQATIHAV